MKLIKYELIGGKFYRNKELIPEEQVKKEINKGQFYKLKKDKVCRVRQTEANKESENKRLFNKYRNQYKISYEPYYGTKRLGFSRLNKNGYYNFVGWLENEEEFETKVIEDIQNQKVLGKRKRSIVEDDDI